MKQIIFYTKKKKDLDRLTTIQGLLREKLDYMKCLDNKILEICKIKDIDKEITDSEQINTQAVDMTKKISKATSEGNVIAASTPRVSHTANIEDEQSNHNKSNSRRKALFRQIIDIAS